MGIIASALLAGCGAQDDSTAVLQGLHACSSGRVVGALVAVSESKSQEDGGAVEAYDTWLLNLDGSAKQVTDDGHHFGAVISPDAETVFHLRTSGRLIADAVELPNIIEEFDIETGSTREIAKLIGIVDLSVSHDGTMLAAAHSSEFELLPGIVLNSATIVDLETGAVGEPMPRAADVPVDVFSAVEAIALAPDGRSLVYSMVVAGEEGEIVETLRVRDLVTNVDSIIFTPGPTESISDLSWSADGETIVAAVAYRLDGDTIDVPTRFRTLRVAVKNGGVSTGEGFARKVSPISRDGNRLLGTTRGQEAEGETRQYEFVAWDDETHVTGRLPFDGQPSSVSIASCSYS